MSNSRVVSCSIRRRIRWKASTTSTRTSHCCRNSRVASAWPGTASAREGSLIRSTNGHSNGIVPWLKTLDSVVAAVNQGGKRKGAACVYLETWHADIEAFLELRDNTGDDARRTHHLNIANWVPDLFMKTGRIQRSVVAVRPEGRAEFPDLWGDAFEQAYVQGGGSRLARKQLNARDLYARMMRTLAQSNGWMTFKDKANRACNQTASARRGAPVESCTEIIEITGMQKAPCAILGSINLARHLADGEFDFEKLETPSSRRCASWTGSST